VYSVCRLVAAAEFIVRVKILPSRVLVGDGYIGLQVSRCMRGVADAAVQCVATGRRVLSVVS